MAQADVAAGGKKKRKRAQMKETLCKEDYQEWKLARKNRKMERRMKETGAIHQTHHHSDTYLEDSKLKSLPKGQIEQYMSSNSIAMSRNTLRPVIEFGFLPIPSKLQTFFSSYSKPTPVQAAAWPWALSGNDCVAIAETGSGKTLAFSIPAIKHVLQSQPKGIRVLILSPTRELALQIHATVADLAQAVGLRAVCVYGGMSKLEQAKQLPRANIVIATPGRLVDLMSDGSADLSKVSYAVLDEADRMLDSGFEIEVRNIIGALSSSRQTLMFTATWPQSVQSLANTFMKNPIHIRIGENREELSANKSISQTVHVIDSPSREQHLLRILEQEGAGGSNGARILIFALYKKEASRVEQLLRRRRYRVAGIHGDLSQPQRTAALDSFRQGSTPLLVATDVAARGLDIPEVKLVINLTFPLTVEDYVHRIGRTGRAGQTGKAITLFTELDKAHSGELINVLKRADQTVPDELFKFGTTVKKKEHSSYGAFYKPIDTSVKATKVTFTE